MDESYFVKSLERCEGYGEIFDLVKKAVKKTIGLHRVGLLLYLESLPLNIGAYHPVGSNSIVLNKSLVNMMRRLLISRTEFNSLIFSLLLHEYLHSLGFLDEKEVRRLVYEISVRTFGEDHPTVKMALGPPSINITIPYDWNYSRHDLELIKDFEKIDYPYIT